MEGCSALRVAAQELRAKFLGRPEYKKRPTVDQLKNKSQNHDSGTEQLTDLLQD